MEKVVIYARVSKSEESLQNPNNQLEPLRKYCEAMNYEIIEEFIDKASGGDSNRPDFQKMLKFVRLNNINFILVWALDRFSREGIIATMNYIEQLRDSKVYLKSLQDTWLDTSKRGVTDIMLSVMSWVAEEERKRISQRTKAGLKLAKKNGKKLGRPKGSKDKKPRCKSGYWDRYYNDPKRIKNREAQLRFKSKSL